MAHAAEVLGIIRRQRLRQEEMAVVVTYDVFDRGFGGGVRVVRDLILQAILR
jgi:hypothetical protein